MNDSTPNIVSNPTTAVQTPTPQIAKKKTDGPIAATVMILLSMGVAAGVATGALKWSEAVARPPVLKPVKGTFVSTGDPVHGKALFGMSCFTCHGPTGAGMKGLGAPLRTSKFVASKTDDQLVAFVKTGRQPYDKDSVLHLTMPPKGGNPALDDKSIHDIIAFIRTLQEEESSAHSTSASASIPVGTLVP
jgi:disulfide bond formation protein DsbB